MMKFALSCAAALSFTAGAQAETEIYSADLAKCLVAKTSAQDKVAMVQWIFSAVSTHPDVAKLAAIDTKARQEYDRGMGRLVDRLLTTDCRAQTVAALKYEGPDALKSSFGVLGQVAMKSLTDNPAVDAAFGAFAKELDEKRLKEVFVEAGIKTPPAATPATK